MNFIISANTDLGRVKDTNQDSLAVMTVNTCRGRMVFAILCDGMGGLALGEVASATVVQAFREWVVRDLPALCAGALNEETIRVQWVGIVDELNEKIKQYGSIRGVRLGTTVCAMLLTQERYYILNVGDSRAYELYRGIRQLTTDHSVVAREVALGHITEEQAKHHPQRNVLLQCVGASPEVTPDILTGPTQQEAVYLLCSDGFRHEISAQEIYENLKPEMLLDEYAMHSHGQELVELNKQRGERDNISLVLVRTF